MGDIRDEAWNDLPLPDKAVEPIRPLVEEARWTSGPMAEQLLLDSQAFYHEWSAPHVQPPYAIYHYTDAGGLKGILESGLLRATDLLYLDGSREFEYAFRLIREHLHKRWTPSDPLLGDFYLQAETALDPRRWMRSLFVACFCENGDALSQWRAHNRNGSYAVGLRTAALDTVGMRVQRAALRRVIYAADRQNALIQRLLDRAAKVVQSTASMSADERAEINASLLDFLIDHVTEFAVSFKPPSLQEEAEWRLAVALDIGYVGEGTWQVQFDVQSGHPVPYVELDVSPKADVGTTPVAEVVCGPIERGELAARSIQLLLKSRGNAGARVRSSALTLSSEPYIQTRDCRYERS